MKPRERAEAVVAELFVNGVGQEAERLVLTSKDGKDLGGWFTKSVADRIGKAIIVAIEEEREACARVVEEEYRRSLLRNDPNPQIDPLITAIKIRARSNGEKQQKGE